MPNERRNVSRDAAKKVQVARNENKVISDAENLDPNDTSDNANYIREVAEDIRDRRGGTGS